MSCQKEVMEDLDPPFVFFLQMSHRFGLYEDDIKVSEC